MDQPGKVANPARGQLNMENYIPLSPCVPDNLVSRDGFSRPVPRQPANLHTQAQSGSTSTQVIFYNSREWKYHHSVVLYNSPKWKVLPLSYVV